MPLLAQFIRSAPAYPISESPSRWLEGCLLNGVDYVVLVDKDQMPVRGMALNQILHLVDPADVSVSAATHETTQPGLVVLSSRSLLDQVSETLALMVMTTESGAAVDQVVANPDRCWVIVDDQNRYQGILDKSSFLAAAMQSSAKHPKVTDRQTADLDFANIKTGDESSSVVLRQNTALLTYLGHELKTPLTSLLGLASLLKMGEVGNLTPRQSRYASLIQQHCRRLAVWVNTLIDLGRLESGSLRLVPQMIELQDVWSEAYQQAVLRTGIEQPLSAYQPPPILQTTPPMTLVADRSRCLQILTCLMQTALSSETDADSVIYSDLLEINQWDNWLGLVLTHLPTDFPLEKLSQTIFSLPFSSHSVPASPLPSETGHWLEWVLVRRLAQLHQGELVMSVQPSAVVRPTLLLPVSPLPNATRDSRFLLLVAPLDQESLADLWQQAYDLNYQLLITPHIQGAIEVARHLPLSAVLVMLPIQRTNEQLETLKRALTDTATLLIGIVPSPLAVYLGKLPVDRELLWPTGRLGSVLLQPPPAMPAPSRLTLLYLRSPERLSSTNQRFPHIFHEFGCRVLEVDDIGQASLLQRVWKADVAVLDPDIETPELYLKSLSQSSELTALPLITLTMAATQAAYAAEMMSVYPCLVEEVSWHTPDSMERMTAWLIQVLQVAASERTKLS